MKSKFLFLSLIFFCLRLVAQSASKSLDSVLMGHFIFPENGKEYRLHPEAEKAFEKMKVAALQEGMDIEVVSSFRSYAAQKRIWNRKFKRFTAAGMNAREAIEKIIEYSTVPGTSRHHWGTDIDLIIRNTSVEGDVLLDSLFHGNKPFSPLRQWMEKNASRFGFYLVYDKDSLRKGFNYEPWHYSFKKIAKKYLTHYVQNKMIFQIKKDSTVLGHEVMDSLFLSKYEAEQILSIHPYLRPED